jgi:glycosyltransferase involved in cell wall biosynthesis
MQATLLKSDERVSSDPIRGRKIRVAYIINSLRDGGAERQLLELLKRHDRERFEVSVLLMDGQNAERVYHLVNDVFVMGIPHNNNSNWLPRTLSFVNAIRRASDYLRKWKPDIAHAMLPAPCILGGIAASLANVPIFVRSPRSMLSLYRSRTRLGAWLDQLLLSRADFTIANSRAVSKELISLASVRPDKCATIHNGVDLDRFHPALSRSWRSSAGWSDQHAVFGIVGNFSPCKRHSDFVEAAAIISERNSNARFVMLGADYGLRKQILSQIEARGLTSRFHIAESTPSPERVFAALDVYVCTSSSEGFSNVLLEAMACGKPVIATNVGGNPEAVIDGDTGFVVSVGSSDEIAAAAEILLRDPLRRREMGLRGRRRVEENFSLKRMTQATEQLYLSLLQVV